MNRPQTTHQVLWSSLSYPMAALISLICTRRTNPMNSYGTQAMTYWREQRPHEFQAIQNPTAHFTAMGEEMQQMVSDLAAQLEGSASEQESYLDRVARIRNARAQAEELMREEFLAPFPPEITREEWEETTQQHQDALTEWAFRMQVATEFGGVDAINSLPTVQEQADAYLLTPAFLENLLAQTSFSEFWSDPQIASQWDASVERRWSRDRTRQEP